MHGWMGSCIQSPLNWMSKCASSSGCGGRRKLERSATSDYTTAESSTLDDFQCQICLGPVKQCVSLEPCGHNWCATCLSHHFASLLQVPETPPPPPPAPSNPTPAAPSTLLSSRWLSHCLSHCVCTSPNTGLIWRPAMLACG